MGSPESRAKGRAALAHYYSIIAVSGSRREGSQCDGVVELTTAVCSSLLPLWGKMHLRSEALSCGSGKGILISPWSKVHPQDVNSTTIFPVAQAFLGDGSD